MNYKKITIFLVLLTLVGSLVFGQALMISKPAASVFLTETETITVKQLEAQISALNTLRLRSGQQTAITSKSEKLEILDMMISDLLIMQGADRDGIIAEESEIDNAVANQKAQYEQQKRRPYTDTEFRNEVIRETGYTWERYRGQMERQIIQQKYILAKKQAEIQSMVKMPENSDIEAFYRQNKTQFSNPDMLRYSQVFISTMNKDAAGRKEAETKINEAYRRYQNGSMTFEQIVNDYTEDQNAKYRNGDSGYIAYSDPNATAYLGKNFMDDIFELSNGEVSRVLISNIGYHIVKITDIREAKLLGLDDTVLPTVTQTVREYIAQQLILKAQNNALSAALNSLVADLKRDADITIFEDNIE
ncbi:MAG: peptidylprolyl isomerase [Spirochaetales bacterium]|uniref:Peptidylprolyl isomerase n=1 Tax=Candidatus Thalassospirochaeta sargassi TaxID=3119039 RepID=A0AAJ1MK22_9SPIO|nr:peptidylprolyl isomerase [Spirochaetales bacterium]